MRRQHAVIGGTGYIPLEDGSVLAYTSNEKRVDTTRDESFALAESTPVSAKWLKSPQFRWFCSEIGQTPEIVERRIDKHTRSCLLVRVPFGVRSPNELASLLTQCAAECNLQTEWTVCNPGAGHLVWEGSGMTAHMLGSVASKRRNVGSKPSRERCVSGLSTIEELDRRESASNGELAPIRRDRSDESYARSVRAASRYND